MACYANYCYVFIFTVFFLHSISRCSCIIIITYSIMPRCDCSQCSHRSLAKCNSHREDKSGCSRKRKQIACECNKRKPKSCECNKCKPVTCDCNKCKPRSCEYNRCKQSAKPTCKCEDYANSDNDNNDSDNAADCNAPSHQFIITVKNY